MSERSEYAGLVSRLTGLAVDAAALTLGGLAVTTLPSLAWAQVIGRAPGWLAAGSAVAGTVLPWTYFTACWWLNGHTAGGLLVGTAVRRRDGGEVSLPQAGIRALVGLLFAPLWLLGLLGVLTDPHRRAWHDRVFRTVVRYTHSLARGPGTP